MKKILTLLSLLAIVFAVKAQNGDISGKVKDDRFMVYKDYDYEGTSLFRGGW